jgi:pimeloyl-ACP methyl ester carboxylesterase
MTRASSIFLFANGPRLLLLAALASCVALCPAPGHAQKEQQKYKPESRVVQTKDRVGISITYYKSTLGKSAPVVVLLHMKDGNRFIWQGERGFAERLQNDGYAVVTVDLRLHGETKGGAAGGTANQPAKGKGKTSAELRKADYQAMIEYDLEAVKKFIFDEHQAENLNMAKMGIVGPEMGATIATLFAMRDWQKPRYDDAPADSGDQTPRGEDVRALVLVSPQTNLLGIGITPGARFLGNPQLGIAVMVGVGKDDPLDRGQSQKIYDLFASATGNKDRMYFHEYPGKLRGTELLNRGGKPSFEDHMAGFFQEHLKKLEIEWIDRRPRFERK